MKCYKNTCRWEITGEPSIPQNVFLVGTAKSKFVRKVTFLSVLHMWHAWKTDFLSIKEAAEQQMCFGAFGR